jgi:multiple sugar transport system ATP-binding protein
MAELALEEVSKRFPGPVDAVKNMNLRVAGGELVVLVGPSGCGKTTVLRLIAGLETPDHGVIRIDGRPVNRLAPAARDVAYVFQRPALYPHLNVRANLEFGSRARRRAGWLGWWSPAWRRRRIEWEVDLAARVTKAARLLRLEDLLRRKPAQLSGGEQQRVALGRAIVRQPALYLLDEPMANLDSNLRMEMRSELHLLHRGLRATMIYVTHDQTEAMTLADRLVVLHQGEALQVGTPLEVYDRPRNQFVAGFLGWPPMNFLTGRLATDAEAGLRLEGKGASVSLAGVDPPPGMTDQELTLGVRPDDVRLSEPGDDASTRPLTLAMDVSAVERLGSHCLIALQRGDWRLTARSDGDGSLGERQTAAVELDSSRLHWFDPTSGKALQPSILAGGRTR